MNLQTRLARLEYSRRKATAHPSPACILVELPNDTPDARQRAVVMAEVDAWQRRPLRERRRLRPWGIGLFECDPALPYTDPQPC